LVAQYFYLELGWLQGIVFLFHQSVVDSLQVLAASPAAILSLNRADIFLSIQYNLACRMHSAYKTIPAMLSQRLVNIDQIFCSPHL